MNSAFSWPERRADRYLNYLRRVHPRYDLSPHDFWFRQAVEEARQDGTAAVLCPMLKQAEAIYERLVTAAHHVSHDSECKPKRSDFGFACSELNKTSSDLMNWTKPAEAPLVTGPEVNAIVEAGNAVQGNDEAEATKPTGGKPATINERMAGTIMKKPEVMGWNSTQWAEHLKCGKSSVVETAAWKRLESARQQAKAERMKDRRRKPKASDSRRD